MGLAILDRLRGPCLCGWWRPVDSIPLHLNRDGPWWNVGRANGARGGGELDPIETASPMIQLGMLVRESRWAFLRPALDVDESYIWLGEWCPGPARGVLGHDVEVGWTRNIRSISER